MRRGGQSSIIPAWVGSPADREVVSMIRKEWRYAAEDGAWRRAGVHDVPDWVEGTVHVGGYAVWAGPGTLRIATRQ